MKLCSPCILCRLCVQGIIDFTAMETFSKELKLAKLLRKPMLTPVWHHKKVHWFFSYVCKPKFARFWCFAARQLVIGAFCLCIVRYIINLVMRSHWRLVTELPCLWFTSETVSLSAILSKGKQLFKKNCLYKHTRKKFAEILYQYIFNSLMCLYMYWDLSSFCFIYYYGH